MVNQSSGTVGSKTVDGRKSAITTLDRRSLLRRAGGMVAGAAAIVGAGTASADTDGARELIELDYDRYDDPSDVYEVWTGTSDLHTFTTDVSYSKGTAFEIPIETKGSNAGNALYRFPDHGIGQVDEVYSSCMVSLPEDWNQPDDDTLRMWFSGLNTSAGDDHSGGGNPTGDDGWSQAVGWTHRDADDGTSPADGEYHVFTYTYHIDQPKDGVGETDISSTSISAGEWFEFATHVKMNTYSNGRANADGESRVWIDGELALERTDWRWTTADHNRIEFVGPQAYYYDANGRGGCPADQSIYYDDHRIELGDGLLADRS